MKPVPTSCQSSNRHQKAGGCVTAGVQSSRTFRLAPDSTNIPHTLYCSCMGPLDGGSQWDSSPFLPPPFLYFPSNHWLFFCTLCFSSLQAFRGEEACRAESHARPQWVPDPGVRQMPASPGLLCFWRPRPTCTNEPTSFRQGLVMGLAWGGRQEGCLAHSAPSDLPSHEATPLTCGSRSS